MPAKPRRDARLGKVVDGEVIIDHPWQVFFEDLDDAIEKLETASDSAASVYKSSTQSITPANTQTKITWSDASHNPGGHFDLSGNEYIIPEDGYYSVSGSILVTAGADADVIRVIIYKDTTLVKQFYHVKQGVSFNSIAFNVVSEFVKDEAISIEIIDVNSVLTVHNGQGNTFLMIEYLHR